MWIDRASLLRGKHKLSGEATLVRAVFWRLCKTGIKTKGCVDTDGSTPALLAYQLIVAQMLKQARALPFNGPPILDALIDRYRNEAVEANQRNLPPGHLSRTLATHGQLIMTEVQIAYLPTWNADGGKGTSGYPPGKHAQK